MDWNEMTNRMSGNYLDNKTPQKLKVKKHKSQPSFEPFDLSKEYSHIMDV